MKWFSFKKKPRPHDISIDQSRFMDFIKDRSINVIIDIGANVGGYATGMRTSGYQGRIISIEPIQANIDVLTALACSDEKWQIAPRMAIGDLNEETVINVSRNNDLSSLRTAETAMEITLPKVEVVAQERVTVRRLDGLWTELGLTAKDRVFVKVDTQGHEAAVLTGAEALLREGRIIGLQLELSLMPLYSGESTYDEICVKLKTLGYHLWYIFPGCYSKKLHRQIQFDGIFFRET